LLDPPGIAPLSAPMSPRFLRRKGPRVANESNDVSRAGNEPRRDIVNVCRGANALRTSRREAFDFGVHHDGGMLITARQRAAGSGMSEADG
jgi:hypothetical protein